MYAMYQEPSIGHRVSVTVHHARGHQAPENAFWLCTSATEELRRKLAQIAEVDHIRPGQRVELSQESAPSLFVWFDQESPNYRMYFGTSVQDTAVIEPARMEHYPYGHRIVRRHALRLSALDCGLEASLLANVMGVRDDNKVVFGLPSGTDGMVYVNWKDSFLLVGTTIDVLYADMIPEG